MKSRPTAEHLRSAWREARDEAATAYRRWCAAVAAERRTAYAVYLAAADREAAAEAAFLSSLQAASPVAAPAVT